MAEIWTRATRQRQPQGAARLSYPASFVFNGIGGGSSPVFTAARPGSSQSGTTVVITGSSPSARADFTLATPPPITGALPWTLVALQYWPSTPASTGIIGLRAGSGPTFCIWSGQLNFYTNSAFVPSGISASAGLHCVALSHDGNGNGIYYYDGQVANVTGLGATGSAVTTLQLMNWDVTGGNYSPGVGAYVAFAAVIDTKVPDEVMRRVTGDKNPWQLFAPERRVSYNFPSGTIKTILKPRARTTQPVGLSQVNWTNPITRSLVALTDAAKRYNAVSKTTGITEGIFETQAVKAKYTNEVGRLYNRFTTASKDVWPVKGTAGNLTFLMYGQLLSTTAAGQDLCSLVTTGNTTVIGFREHSNNQMTLHIRLSNVLEVMLPLGSQTGKSEIFICRVSGTTLRVWRDGKQVGSDITLSGTNFSDIVNLINGSTNWGEPPYGIVHTSAYWTRALSDVEIAEVSRNPWQLFAPERQVIYSLPSSQRRRIMLIS